MTDPITDYSPVPMRDISAYEVWEVDGRFMRVHPQFAPAWLYGSRKTRWISDSPCEKKYWSLPILCAAADTAAMAERDRDSYYKKDDAPLVNLLRNQFPAHNDIQRITVGPGTLVIKSTDLAHHAEIEVKEGGKIVIVNPDGSEFVVSCTEPKEDGK